MRMRPSLIITLGLLSGLTPFAIDLYLPSLPSIARDLASSMEMAQLSVTLYLAVFALSQVFMGPLSDMLGRRATLGAGLLLFVTGTASALSGAVRFGFGATIGSLVSLGHDGTANPLLLGMALSGLLAVGSYWLLCQPDPAQAGNRDFSRAGTSGGSGHPCRIPDEYPTPKKA